MSNSNGQSPFYFNTSNVTIQQTVEYSRCTNLSNFNTSNVTIQQSTLIIRKGNKQISIHLMLLFNNKSSVFIWLNKLFQYI